MKIIDLRSDTVTQPTEEMRKAMFEAQVGDDVYEDDPTIKALEKKCAEIIGKEAALFVPSGTFGNQLALFIHCKRGDEVILADDCHIVQHEVGAAAVIAGVQLRTLASNKGELDVAEIEARIRAEDIHYPRTGLICLENAHSNGRVISLENMGNIYEMAKNYEIPVHLDGARIFNAAAKLGVEPAAVAETCDTVMFCLSKGLCAPVGSILTGSKTFIEKARKGRKLMGGGMRQAGFLAAAGILAVEKMSTRVVDDHRRAVKLGQELSKIPGVKVFLDDIHINMVFFDMRDTEIDPEYMRESFTAKGIKINMPENGMMRFVTHYWIKDEDIDQVVESFKELAAKS